MKNILLTQFGSHVHGTNVPTSDLDLKGVYIPDTRDILLQRIQRAIVTGTKENKDARNTAEDTDLELFSLQQYLKLLMDGQTVALDMMFTPSSFYREVDPIWTELQNNKHRFFSRKASAFVGYCRQQANKYGIKGSRVGEVRKVVDFLRELPGNASVGTYTQGLSELTFGAEHTSFVNHKNKKGVVEVFFECCNRKVPMNATIRLALEVYTKVFEQYGHRALQAENNEGVDWKALMHAVRVCGEAVEFLSMGHITMPRPEKETLLKIRKGEMPYKQVAELIEQGVQATEEAEEKSSLPLEPDYDFADDFVCHYYKEAIK